MVVGDGGCRRGGETAAGRGEGRGGCGAPWLWLSWLLCAKVVVGG